MNDTCLVFLPKVFFFAQLIPAMQSGNREKLLPNKHAAGEDSERRENGRTIINHGWLGCKDGGGNRACLMCEILRNSIFALICTRCFHTL